MYTADLWGYEGEIRGLVRDAFGSVVDTIHFDNDDFRGAVEFVETLYPGAKISWRSRSTTIRELNRQFQICTRG